MNFEKEKLSVCAQREREEEREIVERERRRVGSVHCYLSAGVCWHAIVRLFYVYDRYITIRSM